MLSVKSLGRTLIPKTSSDDLRTYCILFNDLSVDLSIDNFPGTVTMACISFTHIIL